MKEVFINSSIDYLKKNGYNSKLDIEKYTYGLEGLYSFVSKFFVTFLICLIIGTWKEFLLLQLFYFIIRMFAFGIHASNNRNCWIISIIMYVVIPHLIKNINLSNNIILILSIISASVIAIFAPSDTEARPLIRKKKRIVDKILAIVISIIYISIILVYKDNYLSKIIMSALLLEAIMVNPLTYFIFRHPYNNYKNYMG